MIAAVLRAAKVAATAAICVKVVQEVEAVVSRGSVLAGKAVRAGSARVADVTRKVRERAK